MIRRVFTALFALSLAFALVLCLGTPLAAAAAPEPPEAQYDGYLVTLLPPDPQRASLFSAEDANLTPLLESGQVYKANDLSSIRDLVYSGQVALVEPDYKAELFDAVLSPNDGYYISTLADPQEGPQYSLFRMEVQSAWDVGLGGSGVTVAVIDSGLDLDHVDGPVKTAPGRYFYYKEEPGGSYGFRDSNGAMRYYNYYSTSNVADDHPSGHGTMVSGIIAAETDNAGDGYDGGIAGIAPEVTLIPIKCFTQSDHVNSKGEVEHHLGGYTSNLISGINYAMNHDADIINMSWGIVSDSKTLKQAVDEAVNSGCIMIAAAGNGGNATLNYPAAYDNVIGVGATDKNDAVCSFSQRNSSVAVCAPGHDILSTFNSAATPFATGSGTSFSAPAVSAAAALLKQARPHMTQQDFQALLTAENCLPVAGDGRYAGCGILSVRKLLDAVGYAGITASLTADGLRVRGAYHPQRADSPASGGCVILLCAYNAEGHLVDTAILAQSALSSYGGFSAAHTFSALEDFAALQAYFLRDDGTFRAYIPAVSLPLAAQ